MSLEEVVRFENPFEKVTAEQLNHDLVAYLFAKPSEAVYNKLISRENIKIIGGWGSGKTMLLKYISFETQVEAIGAKVATADYIGIYVKTAQSGFKLFLKPGGDFKSGGEALFGHYFNLLILETVLANIQLGVSKDIIKLSSGEENDVVDRILNRFQAIHPSQPEHSQTVISRERDLKSLENRVKSLRQEVETFLNTRDLEKELSYKEMLSVYPTSIRNFLNDVFQDIQKSVCILNQKRFYVLLDECDLLSAGQQKVINTIIKARFTTMVFKLASRPPDIRTMETVDEGVGLTDREIKMIALDELYDPASKSYRKLCYTVAKKRLSKYRHRNQDMRKILGRFSVEDEVGEKLLISYLRQEYPNKKRVDSDFKGVYKDFKMAAAFQILNKKNVKKKYAGFDTFVMLSSGIMLHFLELCRDTFSLSCEKYFTTDEDGYVIAAKIPLPIDLQNKAAEKVSREFYRNIAGRAQSIKDSRINMEFGNKIQYIISLLGGIFREKLRTFNEPEAARIEIPEGIGLLDDSMENPIRQIFETAVAISVFQESKPYMPKRYGGIRPPTYIVNRILAPYLRIGIRPRWRTSISVETFNGILSTKAEDFKKTVLSGKKTKIKKQKVQLQPKTQVTLQSFVLFEKTPVLSYLSNKIKACYFKGMSFIILLHFLRDLIPFINACKKLGMNPDRTIIFYKKYEYPHKEEIRSILQKEGFHVFPVEEIESALSNADMKEFENIIVVEDGGQIVPKLHENFRSLEDRTIGAVEQTTRGVRNDKQITELKFPVVSIAESKLKKTFEPPHVARAVVKSIQKLLPDINFSGKKVLLIGYGTIGKEVALQLRDTLRMIVSVYDSDSDILTSAKQDGYEVERNIIQGVQNKTLIVGSTGETVIKRSEILAMDHNVYLVSTSSEQWEFCINELEALASEKMELKSSAGEVGTRYKIVNTEKYVNLVANGYPINFWKTESMPNEVSDLIMSLMFISAIEVAKNRSLEFKIDSEVTNRIAKEYELSETYLDFHK